MFNKWEKTEMKFKVIWNEESYGNTATKTVSLNDFIERKDSWNLLDHSISDLVSLGS